MLSASTGGATDVGPGPSEDELFEVLSNRRRRLAVHAIEQVGGEADLGDIAERVASWEYDVAEADLSYDERKRVYTHCSSRISPRWTTRESWHTTRNGA